MTSSVRFYNTHIDREMLAIVLGPDSLHISVFQIGDLLAKLGNVMDFLSILNH